MGPTFKAETTFSSLIEQRAVRDGGAEHTPPAGHLRAGRCSGRATARRRPGDGRSGGRGYEARGREEGPRGREEGGRSGKTPRAPPLDEEDHQEEDNEGTPAGVRRGSCSTQWRHRRRQGCGEHKLRERGEFPGLPEERRGGGRAERGGASAGQAGLLEAVHLQEDQALSDRRPPRRPAEDRPEDRPKTAQKTVRNTPASGSPNPRI